MLYATYVAPEFATRAIGSITPAMAQGPGVVPFWGAVSGLGVYGVVS